jgi:hypothetical protein
MAILCLAGGAGGLTYLAAGFLMGAEETRLALARVPGLSRIAR